MIPDLLKEKNEKKFRKKIQEINKLKNSIDKLNNTIANYITKMFQSNLSEKGSHRLRTLLKIIDNLENTADMCSQMSLTILGKNETAAWFTPELRRSLDQLMNLIEKALVMMNDNLNANFGQTKLDQIKSTEQEINTLRNDLKKIYIDGLKQNEYPYQTGIIYNELVGLLEKVGNYIYNINFALYSVK